MKQLNITHFIISTYNEEVSDLELFITALLESGEKINSDTMPIIRLLIENSTNAEILSVRRKILEWKLLQL